MKDRYLIIKEESLDELEREVSRQIGLDSRWKPAGGITVSEWTVRGMNMAIATEFTQVLTKGV